MEPLNVAYSSRHTLMLAMLWLILARALEGVGAGGILGMTMIVIGDIVSLEERGKYAGFISGTVFYAHLYPFDISGPSLRLSGPSSVVCSHSTHLGAGASSSISRIYTLILLITEEPVALRLQSSSLSST